MTLTHDYHELIAMLMTGNLDRFKEPGYEPQGQRHEDADRARDTQIERKAEAKRTNNVIGYSGQRIGNPADCRLEVRVHYANGDNPVLCPKASLAIVNHSPTGFAWGYGGSGPSQLSLAILLDFTRDAELAQSLYMQFKWAFVATWGASWHLKATDLAEWLKGQTK